MEDAGSSPGHLRLSPMDMPYRGADCLDSATQGQSMSRNWQPQGAGPRPPRAGGQARPVPLGKVSAGGPCLPEVPATPPPAGLQLWRGSG